VQIGVTGSTALISPLHKLVLFQGGYHDARSVLLMRELEGSMSRQTRIGICLPLSGLPEAHRLPIRDSSFLFQKIHRDRWAIQELRTIIRRGLCSCFPLLFEVWFHGLLGAVTYARLDRYRCRVICGPELSSAGQRSLCRVPSRMDSAAKFRRWMTAAKSRTSELPPMAAKGGFRPEPTFDQTVADGGFEPIATIAALRTNWRNARYADIAQIHSHSRSGKLSNQNW
jgi:hypothetical protein